MNQTESFVKSISKTTQHQLSQAQSYWWWIRGKSFSLTISLTTLVELCRRMLPTMFVELCRSETKFPLSRFNCHLHWQSICPDRFWIRLKKRSFALFWQLFANSCRAIMHFCAAVSISLDRQMLNQIEGKICLFLSILPYMHLKLITGKEAFILGSNSPPTITSCPPS